MRRGGLRSAGDAILNRDFDAFASIVELDSDMMHSVMMTSTPALHYWKPASLSVMNAVRQWRGDGLSVCYTVDAGPNVHVICPKTEVHELWRNICVKSMGLRMCWLPEPAERRRS